MLMVFDFEHYESFTADPWGRLFAFRLFNGKPILEAEANYEKLEHARACNLLEVRFAPYDDGDWVTILPFDTTTLLRARLSLLLTMTHIVYNKKIEEVPCHSTEKNLRSL